MTERARATKRDEDTTMGDRANIVIEQTNATADKGEAPRVYLYSHWGGHGLAERLAHALEVGRGRWDDESYLARIIFRQMGAGQDGETGYGITTYLTDNEHPLLVVNCESKTVRIEAAPRRPTTVEARSWSFEEYIALTNFAWWTGEDEE